MKPILKLSLVLSAAILAVVGCSMFGANPSAPTKPESFIFNTVTNPVPVVVPAYVTNQQVITQTTVSNVTVFVTNTVPITVPAQTNYVPGYTETVKPGVSAVVQTAGGILNTFFPGIGSLAANGVIALLGALAYGRSQKQGANTVAALTQEMETIRSVLQSVPGGPALDAQFVNWVQGHQTDAGIIQQIAAAVNSSVSNKDAQTAAQQIAAAVAALMNATSPPPGTPVPPVAPKP